ncbi:lipopolysaccharide biosynthesis protein [Chloroflexi bacterium TSY]|nr:lipopolysaccharide biosynthesis protein [Chloroflexi bacterium TSY]
MSKSDSGLAQATIRGVFWTYIFKYSGKLLNFVTITILARLLLREEFGVAGYALILIGFLEVSGLGIGPALIYFEESIERINTGFWLACGVGRLLTALVWVGAPAAGLFFDDPRAVPVTRLLAFAFPFVGLGAVPDALLRKALEFRLAFLPDLMRALSKGLIAIPLAMLDFGAWSLVFAQLVGTAAATATLWIVLPLRLRPALQFDLSVARQLVAYSSNIISIHFLGTFLLNLDYLVIGRYFGAAALGVYFLAFRIPELLIKQLCAILANVLFPVYTRMRNDSERLQQGILTATGSIATLTIPMGSGLALIAKPLTIVFFSEKWIDAAPIMSAISFYVLIRSIDFNVSAVLKSWGRPDILVKLNLLNIVILAPALWWSATSFGTLMAVAWTHVLIAFIYGGFRLYIVTRVLSIPLPLFGAALRPAIVGGLIMSSVVYIVIQAAEQESSLEQLIMGVLSGVVTYGCVVWWLQRRFVIELSSRFRTAFKQGV